MSSSDKQLQNDEFSDIARYYSLNNKQAVQCLNSRLSFIDPNLARLGEAPRVLEISAGAGLLARTLKTRHPEIRLTATEFVAKRFDHECYQGLNAELVECSLEKLPFEDDSFDLVYCNGVLHHVQDLARASDEVCRVLAPGGRALLVEPNRLNPFYAMVGLLKKPERGILFYDIRKELQGAVEREKRCRLSEEKFTCYATFHGSKLNSISSFLQ